MKLVAYVCKILGVVDKIRQFHVHGVNKSFRVHVFEKKMVEISVTLWLYTRTHNFFYIYWFIVVIIFDETEIAMHF